MALHPDHAINQLVRRAHYDCRAMSLRALTIATLAGLLPTQADARLAMGSAGPLVLEGQLLVETVEAARSTGPRYVLQTRQEARSGDRLIFLIRYRNDSAHPLPGYDIVARVPLGVRILPDRNGALRVSADGGKNWARPDAQFQFDTRGHLRPAMDVPATHIRLRLYHSIAPGETGTVAYRGRLL